MSPFQTVSPELRPPFWFAFTERGFNLLTPLPQTAGGVASPLAGGHYLKSSHHHFPGSPISSQIPFPIPATISPASRPALTAVTAAEICKLEGVLIDKERSRGSVPRQWLWRWCPATQDTRRKRTARHTISQWEKPRRKCWKKSAAKWKAAIIMAFVAYC